MKRHTWTVLVLALSWLVAAGCAGKKNKIAQAPAPVEAPAPPPRVEAPPAKPAPAQPLDEAEWFRSATLEELQARLADIYFEYDRADLKSDATSALEQNVSWLSKSYNTVVIEVEGHCDERGTTEYNLALGDRRSGSVASYLLSRGFPRERLKTISYGKERPQCRTAAEDCWWKNRRAHFRIASKGAARSSE